MEEVEVIIEEGLRSPSISDESDGEVNEYQYQLLGSGDEGNNEDFQVQWRDDIGKDEDFQWKDDVGVKMEEKQSKLEKKEEKEVKNDIEEDFQRKDDEVGVKKEEKPEESKLESQTEEKEANIEEILNDKVPVMVEEDKFFRKLLPRGHLLQPHVLAQEIVHIQIESNSFDFSKVNFEEVARVSKNIKLTKKNNSE